MVQIEKNGIKIVNFPQYNPSSSTSMVTIGSRDIDFALTSLLSSLLSVTVLRIYPWWNYRAMNSRKIQWIRVQITTIISLALQENGLQLRSSNDTASQQKYLIFLLKLCFVLVALNWACICIMRNCHCNWIALSTRYDTDDEDPIRIINSVK